MSSFEAVFVTVEGEAYHSVVHQLSDAAKHCPRLRCIDLAEFSPPLPWLKVAVPAADLPAVGRLISECLGCVVVGLAVQTVVDAFGFWRFESGHTVRVLELGRSAVSRDGAAEPWESGVLRGPLDVMDAATAVFRHYQLPRYSDHRLSIGPAWPFRRFEAFW